MHYLLECHYVNHNDTQPTHIHIYLEHNDSQGVITRPNQVSQTFAKTWVCEAKTFSAVFVRGKEGGALVQ